jgi:HD-GYP domain-containing protein (c-di-GMP phosphodiesterase class II)
MWGLAVEQHHERFDGTGYPHRLKGQEVSLAARIVSVAGVSEVKTAP